MPGENSFFIPRQIYYLTELMLSAYYQKYALHFKSPVLTSRGSMAVKNGYYLFITDGDQTGIGECSYIEGLSRDDLDNYEEKLDELCLSVTSSLHTSLIDLDEFPSIRFGYETAMRDLKKGGVQQLFESDFTKGKAGIPINGLVWMGSKDFMREQINRKLEDGFNCIKIKVGAIDFADELMLLHFIRQQFPADVIEIRLDANGAFNKDDVFKKLEALAQFGIHSIEQPVKPGQYALMEKLCSSPVIPVALDEELITLQHISKDRLLRQLKPQYLILKPSLLGGWQVCDEWIELAGQNNIGWWATSALESNIGLNAVAQWVGAKTITLPQGLGTGGLYTDNVASPLYIEKGCLHYEPSAAWGTLHARSASISR